MFENLTVSPMDSSYIDPHEAAIIWFASCSVDESSGKKLLESGIDFFIGQIGFLVLNHKSFFHIL